MKTNITNNYRINLFLGWFAEAVLKALVVLGILIGAETVADFFWRIAAFVLPLVIMVSLFS